MFNILLLRLLPLHPLQLVPLVPLCLSLKVHEAGAFSVDVADGALFVQGVQGEEVGVGGARFEGFCLFGGLFECSLQCVVISINGQSVYITFVISGICVCKLSLVDRGCRATINIKFTQHTHNRSRTARARSFGITRCR